MSSCVTSCGEPVGVVICNPLVTTFRPIACCANHIPATPISHRDQRRKKELTMEGSISEMSRDRLIPRLISDPLTASDTSRPGVLVNCPMQVGLIEFVGPQVGDRVAQQ